MARAASLRLTAADDEQYRRERAESLRTLAMARSAVVRVDRVTAKVRRMSELYRERLEGLRERG